MAERTTKCNRSMEHQSLDSSRSSAFFFAISLCTRAHEQLHLLRSAFTCSSPWPRDFDGTAACASQAACAPCALKIVLQRACVFVHYAHAHLARKKRPHLHVLSCASDLRKPSGRNVVFFLFSSPSLHPLLYTICPSGQLAFVVVWLLPRRGKRKRWWVEVWKSFMVFWQ